MKNLSLKGVIALITSAVSAGVLATEMATAPKAFLTAPISNRHINRIITPFADPSIKTDAVEGVAIQQKGSVLYFSTTQSTPIAAFVTPKGDESQSIRLTLYPSPIESQQVTLPAQRIERLALPANPSEASDHVADLTGVMTDVAKGWVPDGFRQETVEAGWPVCAQAGLAFDFQQGQRWQSSRYDVWIGTLTNTTDQALMLKESHCYQPGVLAVSSYPNPLLGAGARSEIYVLTRRPTATTEPVRRASLLEPVPHEEVL